MNPLDWIKIFGQLGDAAGAAARVEGASLFESIMRGIWDGALTILRTGFTIADQFSIFTVSTTEGPVSVLWPMMLWISGVLALGLFFWHIASTVLHGGRGFVRMATGPFQYGIALAVTVGVTSGFLAAADGLTESILDYALRVDRFQDALNLTGLNDGLSDTVNAVALGLAGLFGVVPAGIGYAIEMLFREAAILLLVATIPITAAGLLAKITASWFWTTMRWLLAAIGMKPALALVIVLGVAIEGGAQGLAGLLVGIGVLLVSLCVPLVLFKLFAFVDPNTDAGAAFRDTLSGAGLDSFGDNSVGGKVGAALANRYGGGSDSDDDGQEQANTDRFDIAAAEEGTADEGIAGAGDAGDSAPAGSGAPSGSGESSGGTETQAKQAAMAGSGAGAAETAAAEHESAKGTDDEDHDPPTPDMAEETPSPATTADPDDTREDPADDD